MYFSFETHAPEAEGADADLAAAYPVSFNMNFVRPSFFALEAEPELSRVIREFDFVALDPQTDGQGDYDPARFLSEWRAGNEFGYSAMFGEPDRHPDVAALPRARLERIWRWNHSDDEAIVGAYSTPPAEVVSFLQSLTPTSQPLVGVNADSVLDAELVAKYRP